MKLATLEDVAEAVVNAKNFGKCINVIAGAGISSFDGGMPLASGVIKDIKEKYPSVYRKTTPKTYPELMKNLPPGPRRDLIAEYAKKAKINLGHFSIAQLVKNGFVQRILTINFDPLITKACTLTNTDLTVYDLADSQQFNSTNIVEQSVLYLHGRYSGFTQLNTKAECKRQSQILEQIFDHSAKERVWIVVGYSGKNDLVFDSLAKINRFDYGLFWICYQDNDPPKYVSKRLLVDEKWAFSVKGFTADSFFITLAQKLNCFLPDFIRWPTPQIRSYLDKLAPYSGPFPNNGFNLPSAPTLSTLDAPQELMKIPEAELATITTIASHYLLAKKYIEVIALLSKYKLSQGSLLRGILASAYMMEGWAICDEADKKNSEEAKHLRAMAEKMFLRAEEAKPEMGIEALVSLFGYSGA